MDDLPAVAGGGIQLAQVDVFLGGGAGFLLQLPLARRQRLLAVFQLACRQLQQHLAVGIAVLAHKQQLLPVGQGGDAHPAGMLHHLPDGGVAAGQLHPVHPHIDDAAFILIVLGQGFFGEIHNAGSFIIR